MGIRNSFITFLLLFCLPFLAVSQHRGYGVQQETWAVGPVIGASNYLGDIGTSSTTERPLFMDMQIRKTKYTAGAFVRYQPPIPNFDFYIRGNLVYSQISGDDALSSYAPRRNRNLRFTTDIFEFTAVAEYLIASKSFFSGGFGRGRWHELAFFGNTGLGLIYFSPRTEYQGQTVRLRPLSTEGQGIIDGKDPYSPVQPVLPLGGEVSYSWKPKFFSLSLEFAWRFTLTDYLDDVSTTYADPAVLRQQKGQAAADLSVRTDELKGEINNYDKVKLYHSPGKQRGDPSDKDHYGYIGLRFNYYIKKYGRIMAPSF